MKTIRKISLRLVLLIMLTGTFINADATDYYVSPTGSYENPVLGGFLSLLPGIYCSGKGSVTVSDFKYKAE